MITKTTRPAERSNAKTDELKALSFIIIVLFPLLSIVGVGAYGFVIWMAQAFGGIVGH